MSRPTRPRLLAPEVVQTSAMDCGPAALKSLLEGFGIAVSYGRLREACQTEVDGTSIDTLEEIARSVGLRAEQVMIPADHLLLPGQRLLPAIVVVRSPTGAHFVILWRRHGPFVQVMDPARGRHWMTAERFLRDVHVAKHRVPASAWRAWAATPELLDPLRLRLRRLGASHREVRSLIEGALADPGWTRVAALDAATRMTASLVGGGGLPRGRSAVRVARRFLEQAVSAGDDRQSAIPAVFWSVEPYRGPALEAEPALILRGAVLVRTGGGVEGQPEATGASRERSDAAPGPDGQPPTPEQPPEVVAALESRDPAPGRTLLRMLLEDGALAPGALGLAAGLAAAGVLVEALLFRALFDVGRNLATPPQRLGALLALVVFLVSLLLLELPILSAILRLGRHLETRMRRAFHGKLPRLVDDYFRSRAVSDMTERSHSLNSLRQLPDLGAQILRTVFALAFTAAGIAWIDPGLAPAAAALAAAPLLITALVQPALAERELRARSHAGALTRFSSDSLLGLIPIRAHRAERSVRREHEALLVDWARASLGLQRLVVTAGAVQGVAGFALAAWILHQHTGTPAGSPAVLLLLFWALSLSTQGRALAQLGARYPQLRNVALRVLEPLGAPEEPASADGAAPGAAAPREAGVHVRLDDVVVHAGGQAILDRVSLEVEPGAHVAIVGASGAGKSSLVGLLLGWQRASRGRIEVDGAALDARRLERLRRQTAWIDPAVHLWNRSLLANLHYGLSPPRRALQGVLAASDLGGVLRRLPHGLGTGLGEGGGFLSGGEGQRVRFGRALGRADARLVLLDEPFRALDRTQRRRLLARAREAWPGATLLHVTHDIEETRTFDRVLVVDEGRVAEQGAPGELAARADSLYNELLRADSAARDKLWGAAHWKRLWLERGGLHERGPAPRVAARSHP
ncbi:MAG: cysteine peptidase family C39 domain-containing protein [Planctomycetota bacterium]